MNKLSKILFCIGAVLLAGTACSDKLKSSHSHKSPPEFADITISSSTGNEVISHAIYRNTSSLNTFHCHRDLQSNSVYFDARVMIQQADGSLLPQWLELFFPLVANTGKQVLANWGASDQILLVGRLAEPAHLNADLSGDLKGSCSADIQRSGRNLSGNMTCTNFNKSGPGQLGSFDLQISDFSCVIQ